MPFPYYYYIMCYRKAIYLASLYSYTAILCNLIYVSTTYVKRWVLKGSVFTFFFKDIVHDDVYGLVYIVSYIAYVKLMT